MATTNDSGPTSPFQFRPLSGGFHFAQDMAASFARATALLFLVAAPLSALEPPPSPVTNHADAELTSVFFLDADHGWAVGDRGVIWHTPDGGRTWRQQNSPTHCRLEAVQFLDSEIGWAVGGYTQQYTHQTSGVVLRTRDGGRTWAAVSTSMLPALKQIKFFDAKNGWAIGASSHLYPAGVFRSDDGGRSWAPVPRGRTLGWVTGDFRSPASGAVAGHAGQLGLVVAGGANPSKTTVTDGRYLRRLQLTGQSSGWLVGDGGLVLTTADDGFNWTPPQNPLPSAAPQFDFRALATFGNQVWIAGAPGTCIFHSADAGQTWQIQRTDQALPLRALTFVDENRGWAVGALGTILATRDGGQTWRRQKSGGSRLALLGIFGDPQRVPFELLALESGDEGFLSAVEILGRQDGALAPKNADLADRAHEAVVAVGGSAADTAWRFPLPQAGLAQTSESILKAWDKANDGQASQRLEEHLVRRIRQWQPEVIVTEDVSPRGDHALAHLTNQLVLTAAQKAADEAAYPEQIQLAGLHPWKPKKVFSLVAAEKQGLINITPSQWAPRLGRSLAESAELGRGLLVSDVDTAPRNVGLSLLLDHLPQATGRRNVFSGIALLPGGETRRTQAEPPAAGIDALSRASQKRHNVQQLLARIQPDDPTAGAWLSQVNELTRGMSDRSAGEILYQLAVHYHHAGLAQPAAEAMQLLADRHPHHPLADAAALWLVQYYGSGEMTLRERKSGQYVVGLAIAQAPPEPSPLDEGTQSDDQVKPALAVGGQVQSVSAASAAATGLTPVQRAGRAVAVAKSIERSRPPLFADPAMKFPFVVALRNQGNGRQAERMFMPPPGSKRHKETDSWLQCEAAEEWLPHKNGPAPKSIFSCLSALEKPRLDGRLDDRLWQLTQPVSLTSPLGDDAHWPATAATAFDEQFLYFAVSCRKADGVAYPTSDDPRPRDADLSASDRIEILLDIDRDYASYYRLAIDSRGWTSDACFGDSTWNPTWYVAAGGDAQYWTAEIAIPWNQLSAKPPQAKNAWAIGVQRAAGHVGFQSFSQPAAVQPRPEGFGLLMFE